MRLAAAPTTEPKPDTTPVEPEKVPAPLIPPDAEPLEEPGTLPSTPIEPLPGSCPMWERWDTLTDLSQSPLPALVSDTAR